MFEPGISVGNLARCVLARLNEDNFSSSFPNSICKLLYPLVAVRKLKNEDREKIFNQFYNICVNDSNIKLWDDFLVEIGVNVLNSIHSLTLFQFILDIFFKNSLTYQDNLMKKENSVEETADSISLDSDEQQSLRYVAGYVSYSLRKSFLKLNSPDSKVLLKLTSMWGADADADKEAKLSFLDYTKTWVDATNRGGLIAINHQFFILIRRIENVARSVLNLNLIVAYCGDDMRKVLIEKFQSSSLIQDAWENLTNKISNKPLATKLLHKIFNKWVNIRVHAFVNVWIQSMKRKASWEHDKKKKKNISEKGEPALRKTLASRKKSAISEKGEPSLRKTVNKKTH